MQLSSTTSSEEDFHVQLRTGSYMRDHSNDQDVFTSHSVLNVSASGDVSTAGSITASGGEFSVESGGLVTAQSMNVVNSLDVHGSAVVEDSLTIGSGFALTPEGMTIDTNK